MRSYFKALWQVIQNKPLMYKFQIADPLILYHSAKEHLLIENHFFIPDVTISTEK